MKRIIILTILLAAVFYVNAQSNRNIKGDKPGVEAQKNKTTGKTIKERSDNESAKEGKINEKRISTGTPADQSKREISEDRENIIPGRKTTLNSKGGGVPVREEGTATTPDSRHDSPGVKRDREVVKSAPVVKPEIPSPSDEKSGLRWLWRPRVADKSVQSVRSDEYKPRVSKEDERSRKAFETPARKAVDRTTDVAQGYINKPVEYRRVKYPYKVPARVDIRWTLAMYKEYRVFYPEFNHWYYPLGYRIHTISAYDAGFYIGEIARVYGMVYSTWHSRATDEYYLYFGGPYPYQDFSVILPAKVARRINWRPERYFLNRHIAVTGLISRWEGKPEILLRNKTQMDIY